MYGFGKMILLAFVSVACLMSQATVANAKVDELEDLMENIAEHLENADLVSLFPSGMDMVNQLLEAGGMDMVNQLLEAGKMFTKRNNGLETIIPSLMSIFSDKSHTGGNGSLLTTMIKNFMTMLLKNALGEKMFAQIEPLIAPLVDTSFMVFQTSMKILNASMSKNNTTSTSNTTDVKVASRAIPELTELHVEEQG